MITDWSSNNLLQCKIINLNWRWESAHTMWELMMKYLKRSIRKSTQSNDEYLHSSGTSCQKNETKEKEHIKTKLKHRRGKKTIKSVNSGRGMFCTLTVCIIIWLIRFWRLKHWAVSMHSNSWYFVGIDRAQGGSNAFVRCYPGSQLIICALFVDSTTIYVYLWFCFKLVICLIMGSDLS